MTRTTSRRRLPRLAVALTAVALALAGCSGSGDGDASAGADATQSGSTSAGGTSMPEGEGSTEYPLTVETAWGESTLEERPDRVAAVSPTARDVELLAMLGVTPVIAPESVERSVWTLDAVPGEIETMFVESDAGLTPAEEIAAADPDLIIAFGKNLTDEYETLSTIAPVVAATSEEDAESADWRAELRAIGAALDLEEAAEEAISEHEAWFEQARADNPQFEGLTSTYLVQYAAEYGLAYFSTPGSDAEQLFLDLGFAPNPLAEEFAADDTVSSELLSMVDADVLLVANNTNDEAELEKLLTGNQLFQNLEVVQDDHYAIINGTDEGYEFNGEEHEGNLAWALASAGPLGKQWAAEQLIPILADTIG